MDLAQHSHLSGERWCNWSGKRWGYSVETVICVRPRHFLSLSLTLPLPTKVVELGHSAALLASVCSMETVNQWSLEAFPLSLCRSPTINEQQPGPVHSPPGHALNYQPWINTAFMGNCKLKWVNLQGQPDLVKTRGSQGRLRMGPEESNRCIN